jgi:hypothetical protein
MRVSLPIVLRLVRSARCGMFQHYKCCGLGMCAVMLSHSDFLATDNVDAWEQTVGSVLGCYI